MRKLRVPPKLSLTQSLWTGIWVFLMAPEGHSWGQAYSTECGSPLIVFSQETDQEREDGSLSMFPPILGYLPKAVSVEQAGIRAGFFEQPHWKSSHFGTWCSWGHSLKRVLQILHGVHGCAHENR